MLAGQWTSTAAQEYRFARSLIDFPMGLHMLIDMQTDCEGGLAAVLHIGNPVHALMQNTVAKPIAVMNAKNFKKPMIRHSVFR